MESEKEIQQLRADIENLQNELATLRVKNIDLTGRRIINASASVDPTDYVTREELVGLKNNLQQAVDRVAESYIIDPLVMVLADVGDIPAGHRADFGEGTPSGIENPRYTIDHAGVQTVGLCIEITPPADAEFSHARLTLDPEQDGEDKIDVGNHKFPSSGYTSGDPYYAVVWYKRPEVNQTWDVEGHSVGDNGKLLYEESTGYILAVPVTAVEGVGYPTIGTITEQDVSNWDVPATLLTIPYTAPSSGSFVGFTVFRKKSTEGDDEYRDDANNEHPGGYADGLAGSITRVWEKEASDVTWDVVLSPNTKWKGQELNIAPDSRNKGQVTIEAPGSPSATGITDAAVNDFEYDWELRDDYGHPSFNFNLTYTHPPSDANFFRTYCTVQLVNAAGTGIPGHPFGNERHFGGDGYPGKAVTIDPPGPWGPVGHPTYNRFRIRIYAESRREVRVLQTQAFGGAPYYDIVTADQVGYPTLGTITQQGQVKDGITPYVQVTFPWTAPSSGSLKAISLHRKIGTGDWEEVMNIDVPNGADGGSYSFHAMLPKPELADETWYFSLSPHTSWDGSRLWIAPDSRNYDSIVVSKVGAPADGKITDATVDDWDPTGSYDDFGMPTFNGIISYTNPSDDSNYMHSEVTIQLVNSSGTGVPSNALGTERKFAGGSGPGIEMEFAFGPWGPMGHATYNRFRFKVYTVNRYGVRTQQTTAWGGQPYYDLVTSDPGRTLNARRLDSGTLGDGVKQDGSYNLTLDNGPGLVFNAGQLVVNPGSGTQLSGDTLAVKYNSTYIGVNGSGELEVDGVRAQDVIAGQLVVGVTMVASQMISGEFTGCTMTLTNGGITTKLNNATYRSVLTALYTVNGSSYDLAISPGELRIGDSGASTRIRLHTTSGSSTGTIKIIKSTGANAITLQGGSSPYVDVGASGTYKLNGSDVINNSGQFVGPGVITTGGAIGGTAFNVYQSGWYYGHTGPTNFTTADGKTATVRGGIIVALA